MQKLALKLLMAQSKMAAHKKMAARIFFNKKFY